MKISKRIVLIMWCIFTIAGLWLIVEAVNKNLYMDFDNAVQHIERIRLISDKDTTNSIVVTMSEIWSGLTKIETDNFIKDDSNSIVNVNNSKSTILWWLENKIEGWKYIVILGWLRNIINWSYSSVLWWEWWNIAGGQWNSILWWKDNLIRWNNYSVIVWGSWNKINGSYSAVIWVDSSVEWDYSIALWKNSKLKADNSFLWTDWNYADETLQTDNVFVVMSMSGMVINTGSAHKFAKLTIGWPIIMYADKNDENAECGWGIWWWTLKVVNNKSNTGQVCLCSCDGSGRNSVFGKGKCQSTCNVTIEPKCGTDVQKICSDGKYMYSWSCEKWEVIEWTWAYMVSKDDKIHWSCQSTDGAVVWCSGTVLATPAKCEKIECAWTKPSWNGVIIVDSWVDVNGTSKWKYEPNNAPPAHSCQWTCATGYDINEEKTWCEFIKQFIITYKCDYEWNDGNSWTQMVRCWKSGSGILASSGCTQSGATLRWWSETTGKVWDPDRETWVEIDREWIDDKCNNKTLYPVYDKCPDGQVQDDGRCVIPTTCETGYALSGDTCVLIGSCNNEFDITTSGIIMTGLGFTASGLDWYKPLWGGTGRWTCVNNSKQVQPHTCTFRCEDGYECGIHGSWQLSPSYHKNAVCMPKIRCNGDYSANDSPSGIYKEIYEDVPRHGRVYKNPTWTNTDFKYLNTTGELYKKMEEEAEWCFIVCKPWQHWDSRSDGVCIPNCVDGTTEVKDFLLRIQSYRWWNGEPRRDWKYKTPEVYNDMIKQDNIGSGEENSCLWTCTGGGIPIQISRYPRQAYSVNDNGTTGEVITGFNNYFSSISGQFYNIVYNICRRKCAKDEYFQLTSCKKLDKWYQPSESVTYSGIENFMLQKKIECRDWEWYNYSTGGCVLEKVDTEDMCKQQNTDSMPDRYRRDKDWKKCFSCSMNKRRKDKNSLECVPCDDSDEDPNCTQS